MSLVLNVRRYCEDVTSDGRLFQVLAAATGNARSPIVESRVSRTASAEVDDERRRCLVDQEVQRATGSTASARDIRGIDGHPRYGTQSTEISSHDDNDGHRLDDGCQSVSHERKNWSSRGRA